MGQNTELDSDKGHQGPEVKELPLHVVNRLVPMPFPLAQDQANHMATSQKRYFPTSQMIPRP